MDADFIEGVYQVVAAIPYGRVLTYGMVARLVGKPNYSRMVGRVLRECPSSMGLPCHRVVNSEGRLCPGWAAQASLLQAEGVILKGNGYVDLRLFRWRFEDLSVAD